MTFAGFLACRGGIGRNKLRDDGIGIVGRAPNLCRQPSILGFKQKLSEPECSIAGRGAAF
ncbi:hypothetical protein AM571_PC00467 (plasmid) [Rhizobium etli 8C-3]|uniref:Uncharacterized protein n=1 Tax=Rhizobium etli 8C-3 TaxID=538025 RepID=A0A1L5PDJ1_RHIET|nr:hypothetical protein AM571_PC00467 [Rhizobium etli 8C-3]